MLRLSIEYVEPATRLARNIYDINGRTMLAAGTLLTEKHLIALKKWDICSIFVDNPVISLPKVDEIVEESCRLRSVQAVKSVFENTEKTGAFQMTVEQQTIVNDIVSQVLRNRFSIIHLAQIQRHDDNLFTHSINVTVLATMTAVSMGTSNSKDLYTISLGALLHDIGKVAIPKKILEQIGRLSPEDLELYKTHTTIGFELLRKSNDLPLLSCHIAFQHHERIDGQGYPRNISGNDISRFALIVAIANEYDNMLADKPGLKGLPPHLAYEKIMAGVNNTFDQDAAQAFLSHIALYPIGTILKLENGQIAIVTSVTAKMQHRPKLKIIADEQGGEMLSDPYNLDLTDKQHLTLFIKEVLDDAATVEFFKNNRQPLPHN